MIALPTAPSILQFVQLIFVVFTLNLTFQAGLSFQKACSPICQNDGVCDQFLGDCTCRIGYSGADCSIDNLTQCRYKGYLHHYFMYTFNWNMVLHASTYKWQGMVTCECLQQLIIDSGKGDDKSGPIPCLDIDISEMENAIKDPDAFRRNWKIFKYDNGKVDLDPNAFSQELQEDLDALRPLNECVDNCGDLGWCAVTENVTQCECSFSIATRDKSLSCVYRQQGSPCLNRCSNQGECIEGNFCKCNEGAWGIDCNFAYDNSSNVVLKQVSKYELSDFEQYSGTHHSGIHRPRIYIYDTPPEFITVYERHQWLISRFVESKYRTHDPYNADYFIIPHMNLARRSQIIKLMDHIQNRYPFFNESITRGVANHIMFQLLDHGPGDAGAYKQSEIGSTWIRPEWNWANPDRSIMSFYWNGRTDGAAANQSRCLVCFQPGKDILLPVPRHRIDGPLHGYTQDDLDRLSPWVNRTDISQWPLRKYTLFFAGRVWYQDNPNDESGRGQLYAHHRNSSNFLLVNSEVDEKVPLPDSMANSVFCYAPYGTQAGDGRRYMGAVLFGCIPVWFSFSDAVRQAKPFEELSDMSWYDASVFVTRDNMSSLHEYLHSFTEKEIYMKRQALGRIVERLLFTSIDGPLLGEDGHRDAFQAIIKILGERLRKY